MKMIMQGSTAHLELRDADAIITTVLAGKDPQDADVEREKEKVDPLKAKVKDQITGRTVTITVSDPLEVSRPVQIICVMADVSIVDRRATSRGILPVLFSKGIMTTQYTHYPTESATLSSTV